MVKDKRSIARLDRLIHKMTKVTGMLLEIRDGNPVSATCAKYGFKESRLQWLFRAIDHVDAGQDQVGDTKGDTVTGTDPSESKDPFFLPTLCFEERLFKAVYPSAKLSDIPSDVEETMHVALKLLKYRERKVLHMRFEECLTLSECGRILDLSGTRVQQIEAKALRKLRSPGILPYIKAGDGWCKSRRALRMAVELEQEARALEAARLHAKEIQRLRDERLRLYEQASDGILEKMEDKTASETTASATTESKAAA